MYLMWYDDSKQDTPRKLAAACQAYTQRFGAAPTVALVAPMPVLPQAPPGVTVRAMATVRPDTFWIGREEQSDA